MCIRDSQKAVNGIMDKLVQRITSLRSEAGQDDWNILKLQYTQRSMFRWNRNQQSIVAMLHCSTQYHHKLYLVYLVWHLILPGALCVLTRPWLARDQPWPGSLSSSCFSLSCTSLPHVYVCATNLSWSVAPHKGTSRAALDWEFNVQQARSMLCLYVYIFCLMLQECNELEQHSFTAVHPAISMSYAVLPKLVPPV